MIARSECVDAGRAKRLLIVSPKPPPLESADNRRVAQMLPYLEAFGWTPHIVHFDSGVVSMDLGSTRAKSVAVPRASWWSVVGARGPGYAGASALDRAVSTWHRERPFDLALFSHTQFELWRLGPRWKRNLDLPFVLDWQDPWVTDYHAQHPNVPKPGGAVRYGIVQFLARHWEPKVVREASGHISVSSAYPARLTERYGALPAATQVIPFAYDARELVGAAGLASPWRPPNASSRYWAYVGRGGDDMSFAVRVILGALAEARRAAPDRFANLKLYFVGTDYAPAPRARQTIAPIARELGVNDLVEEFTERIPYSDALRFLMDAEALVVPGSDDPGYSASKVLPYLHVSRPLLAVFHADSDVQRLLNGQPGVRALGFSNTSDASRRALIEQTVAEWMNGDPTLEVVSGRRLAGFDAESMTRRVAAVLDQAIEGA